MSSLFAKFSADKTNISRPKYFIEGYCKIGFLLVVLASHNCKSGFDSRINAFKIISALGHGFNEI